MKKIISFALIVYILLSVFMISPFSVSATSEKIYKNKIKAAINAQDQLGVRGVAGYGFLYDFDKNGTKELVMSYASGSDYNNMNYKIDIYTIKGKKAKRIFHKSYRIMDQGMSIGVAKKNGKRYFMLYTMFPNGATDAHGKILMYSINKTKVTLKITGSHKYVLYRSGTEMKATPKMKINGKKKTVNQYMKWQKSYKLSYVKREKGSVVNQIDHYFYENRGKCKTLESLYNTL